MFVRNAMRVSTRIRGVMFPGVLTSNNTLNIRSLRNYASESDKADSMVGRDFLTLKHFTKMEIEQFLWTAMDLKYRYKEQGQLYAPLAGKSLALIFQKRSTRTRLSSETGFALLGGKPCFLSPDDIHLGVNESIRDSGRVLSGFVDIILARVNGQEILDELAKEASVPVINGLSDTYHPLQTLADLMTLQEHYGYLSGLTVAWVGHGNYIIHSLLMGGLKMGVNFNVATPQGYECFPEVMKDAMSIATKNGTKLEMMTDPREAVTEADVIVTRNNTWLKMTTDSQNTWIGKAQEKEPRVRQGAFAGFKITRKVSRC